MPPERSQLMANALNCTSYCRSHVCALGQGRGKYIIFWPLKYIGYKKKNRVSLFLRGAGVRVFVLTELYFLWHQRRKFLSSKTYTKEAPGGLDIGQLKSATHKPHPQPLFPSGRGLPLGWRVGSKGPFKSSLLTASKSIFVNSTSCLSKSTLACSSTLFM